MKYCNAITRYRKLWFDMCSIHLEASIPRVYRLTRYVINKDEKPIKSVSLCNSSTLSFMLTRPRRQLRERPIIVLNSSVFFTMCVDSLHPKAIYMSQSLQTIRKGEFVSSDRGSVDKIRGRLHKTGLCSETSTGCPERHSTSIVQRVMHIAQHSNMTKVSAYFRQ